MVRVASDPRIKVQIQDLNAQEVNWFLKQFLDEYHSAERQLAKLLGYLPKLKEAISHSYSESMQQFLRVLNYATSEVSEKLRITGHHAVQSALSENDLSQKVNFVVEAIESFVEDAQNYPTFILTESAGYFGTAELEEFDQKITSFKNVHELFKEHVSLENRTKWIYERHHTTLFTSIFSGSHLDLVAIQDKIRDGASIEEFHSNIRDCQGMLLGVSQAYSLFLEFSAYSEQMLTLVDAYKQIAAFLQSKLLQILYSMEIQRNHLFLEFRDDFRYTLDEFQQTLLAICTLNSNEN